MPERQPVKQLLCPTDHAAAALGFLPLPREQTHLGGSRHAYSHTVAKILSTVRFSQNNIQYQCVDSDLHIWFWACEHCQNSLPGRSGMLHVPVSK